MSKLYVVSTPIGNLNDMSSRAVSALEECSIIACEDTRITNNLLQRFSIEKKTMICYRDDNEHIKSKYLLQKLQSGESIALVTDAGTPGLSDPGFRIVRECRKNNIDVVPVPGCCAIIAALSCSGLPTNGFLFLGFLPAKTSARIKTFEKFKDFEYTLCFFESCHRIDKFIDDALSVFEHDRVICISKEITKLHEQFFVGTLITVSDQLKNSSLKGEFVVCIAPSMFSL